MSANAPFNLEIKEKRNTRDFYPQGSTVSHWPRFIPCLVCHFVIKCKVGSGQMEELVGAERLRVMPVDCNCVPFPRYSELS